VADWRAITIISGGQTGADRAAIDFAIEHNIRHGGWCPRGRLAEDGRIAEWYSLRETPSRSYAERTEWNVRDSDATVVFSITAEPRGGTRLTLAFAERLGKPVLHLSRDQLAQEVSVEAAGVSTDSISAAAKKLLAFLAENSVQTLNVAGPRASQEPDIAAFVAGVLKRALAG
jgi:Circularly permutated YpsA SLOG family